MQSYGHGWTGANGTLTAPRLHLGREDEPARHQDDPRVDILAKAYYAGWEHVTERVRNMVRDGAADVLRRIDTVRERPSCATGRAAPAPMVRTPDHDTSIAGAAKASETAEKMQAKLLMQYREAGDEGLTDEEAGLHAEVLDQCYWKRCGELRRKGLIEYTGEKRSGSKGVARKVSRVT